MSDHDEPQTDEERLIFRLTRKVASLQAKVAALTQERDTLKTDLARERQRWENFGISQAAKVGAIIAERDHALERMSLHAANALQCEAENERLELECERRAVGGARTQQALAKCSEDLRAMSFRLQNVEAERDTLNAENGILKIRENKLYEAEAENATWRERHGLVAEKVLALEAELQDARNQRVNVALDLNEACAERDHALERIDKGMDYEHHTSCGHTACPECFAQLRADLLEYCKRLEAALAARDALVEKSRPVLDAAVVHLQNWLDGRSCESLSETSGGGHFCGRDAVQTTLDQLRSLGREREGIGG